MLVSYIALLYSLSFSEPRLVEEYSDTNCSQISLCFTDGQHLPQSTHVSTKLSKTSSIFQTQNEIVSQHVLSSFINTTLFYSHLPYHSFLFDELVRGEHFVMWLLRHLSLKKLFPFEASFKSLPFECNTLFTKDSFISFLFLLSAAVFLIFSP